MLLAKSNIDVNSLLQILSLFFFLLRPKESSPKEELTGFDQFANSRSMSTNRPTCKLVQTIFISPTRDFNCILTNTIRPRSHRRPTRPSLSDPIEKSIGFVHFSLFFPSFFFFSYAFTRTVAHSTVIKRRNRRGRMPRITPRKKEKEDHTRSV